MGTAVSEFIEKHRPRSRGIHFIAAEIHFKRGLGEDNRSSSSAPRYRFVWIVENDEPACTAI
jgi:hypothetical protein